MQRHKAPIIVKKIANFFGVVVTAVAFSTIFVTFVVTIISRYILKTPVAWSYEIAILSYMWTMFFGVGKALERDEHVVFGLVYDSVSPKVQGVFRVLSNLILIILLGLVFFPSIDSLLSKRMVTGVLKLPYKVVFAPLIFMFFDVLVRSILHLIRDIRELCHLKQDPPPNSHEVPHSTKEASV